MPELVARIRVARAAAMRATVGGAILTTAAIPAAVIRAAAVRAVIRAAAVKAVIRAVTTTGVVAAAVAVTATAGTAAGCSPDPPEPVAADECVYDRPGPRAAHVQQRGGGENDCGPAAMAMVLRSFGLLSVDAPAQVQTERLRLLTRDAKVRGTSLWGAEFALRELGVQAVPFTRMGVREARGMMSCQAAIIRFERLPGREIGHGTAFVPVGDVFVYSDPTEIEPRAYRLDDLDRIWDGVHGGLVVKDPAVSYRSCLLDACTQHVEKGAAVRCMRYDEAGLGSLSTVESR